MTDVALEYLIDEGSQVTPDGVQIESSDSGVLARLYGAEFGKSSKR